MGRAKAVRFGWKAAALALGMAAAAFAAWQAAGGRGEAEGKGSTAGARCLTLLEGRRGDPAALAEFNRCRNGAGGGPAQTKGQAKDQPSGKR